MNSNYNYNKKLKYLARQLRKDLTPGEIKLWVEVLSKRQMKGYRFLRQRPILNYIADFFCKELKLVIEVDGFSHFYKYEDDLKRDKELNIHGYRVCRVFEEDVMRDTENVIREIESYIGSIEWDENTPLKGERSRSKNK